MKLGPLINQWTGCHVDRCELVPACRPEPQLLQHKMPTATRKIWVSVQAKSAAMSAEFHPVFCDFEWGSAVLKLGTNFNPNFCAAPHLNNRSTHEGVRQSISDAKVLLAPPSPRTSSRISSDTRYYCDAKFCERIMGHCLNWACSLPFKPVMALANFAEAVSISGSVTT